MRKFTILAFVCALTLAASCGKSKAPEWPRITKENKPWTRWWWQGSAFNEKDITAALEQYKAAGLGGVEITPIYQVHGYEDRSVDFLSAEWMRLLEFTLREAERLDLGVDLANASGWPFGGPWVSEDMESKNFNSKVYNLKGGESLTEPLKFVQQPLVRMIGERVDISELREPIASNPDLQAHAFEQVRFKKELPLIIVTANSASGEFVDLTDKVAPDGTLDWVAPQGDWTVCALFMGYHGKMVERAGPGGEGMVIDHFSKDALDRYLKHFDEAAQGHDLSYLRYYFNDSYEVDDATGESNWTPLFFEEFKALRGYDLKENLPALLSLDTPDKNSRVIYDYFTTINDLLLERYTKGWQSWAARQGKGIRNQAHGSPANILDLYAASDVPETEGRDILSVKSAPSAMHVTGKKYASSESATWLGEHFTSTLGEVKGAMDLFLLGGVNHTFYHGTAFSPVDAPWPGFLFYAAVHFTPANSFWTDFKAFNDYIARAQSVLQSGTPDNDLLLYYPVPDLWSKQRRAVMPHFHGLDRSFADSPVRADAEAMQSAGYAWDLISDRQLLDTKATETEISTPGANYKALLLPAVDYMPLETVEAVMKLARDGATVLIHGGLPKNVAGYAGYEEKQAKMDALFAELQFNREGNIDVADYGNGVVMVGGDEKELLETVGMRREPMYDLGLQAIRRKKDTRGTFYFIVNSNDTAFEGWAPVASYAKSMAVYNPMTGETGYAQVRDNSQEKEVYLQLQPGESVIVETFDNIRRGDEFKYYKSAGAAQPFTGEWAVKFTMGGPELPRDTTLTALSTWTAWSPAHAIFSGTAEYTTTLPAVPEGADGLRLDLGYVGDDAAVYVNGKYLSTLFESPYAVNIDKSLLAEGGELTVKVSNSMANRIIDLDNRGVNWRIFYNTNFPARIGSNRGEDGLFSAAGWESYWSGIVGPVTTTPVSLITN